MSKLSRSVLIASQLSGFLSGLKVTGSANNGGSVVTADLQFGDKYGGKVYTILSYTFLIKPHSGNSCNFLTYDLLSLFISAKSVPLPILTDPQPTSNDDEV
jgi:hypothetical protein